MSAQPSLYEMGPSLHENTSEGSAERGQRIVLVIGTAQHNVRVDSYRTKQQQHEHEYKHEQDDY